MLCLSLSIVKTELSQGFEHLCVPGHWIQNAMEAPSHSGYSLNNKIMYICALVNPHSIGSCYDSSPIPS